MDNKKKYEYRDSSGVEHCVELETKNFRLAQTDKAIHDQKFKTKPTTFFKDALKRFGKNKSSVVGAVILGVLLILSVVVPIIDTSDLNVPKTQEAFLEPKLFNAGTGFWDGTKRMTNIPCDPSTAVTDDKGNTIIYPDLTTYPINAISKLSSPRISYVNSATRLAKGGFAQLTNKNKDVVDNVYENLKKKEKSLISQTYAFDLEKEYALKIQVLDEKLEGYAVAQYEVSLIYDVTAKEKENLTETHELILKHVEDELPIEEVANDVEPDKPFTVEYFENKDILKDLREDETLIDKEIDNIRIKIGVLPLSGSQTSLLLKNVVLTSTQDTNLAKNDVISFTNANEFLLTPVNAANYWVYDDVRGVYKAFASVCDFTYDTYEAAYGKKRVAVSQKNIENYVEKGWLKPEILDNFDALYNRMDKADELFQTFVANAKKLPIVKLHEVKRVSYGDISAYEFDADVIGYKILGYDSMPRFLAGTDGQGYNLLKQVFVGLRNSLGLGLLTFAICFSFGLIFGAICGYFGGTIDIALQRLVDILSGVPWIVIMTLCVLHLGSNFWTFILAMCLTGWIGTSSLTRTQFYRFRDREYTLASRTLGASNPRLIFRHILPNAMGTIITSSVLMIPSVIFSEATISYLGLGFQDMTSLGVTLSQNQTYLLTYPHLILFPSAIMALIMISFNLFGNGLRDAFNPSLKGSE